MFFSKDQNDQITIISTRIEPYNIVSGFYKSIASDGVLLIHYYCEALGIDYSLFSLDIQTNENKLLVNGTPFNSEQGLDNENSEDFTGAIDQVSEL